MEHINLRKKCTNGVKKLDQFNGNGKTKVGKELRKIFPTIFEIINQAINLGKSNHISILPVSFL
jgi:hypothetical protein